MQAALVVLDGWGLGPEADPEHRNAVAAAETPNFDSYVAVGADGTLRTSGRTVGLPDGQMGNSEVGHLTVGAGRVVEQPYARIDDAVARGALADVPAIDEAFEHAVANGGRVHFLGLVSDGGVHADQRHLHALVRAVGERGVPAVTHAFTDGRDTPPRSAVGYLEALEAVVAEAGTGQVATVSGRYYAMDRDENWDRTRRAYDAIVNREADHEAPSAVAAVEASYERGDDDEFVEPTLVVGASERTEGPALRDGDSVVFCNFRGDRARQLTRLLTDHRPVWGFETDPPDVHVATMTEYDETFGLPVAFPPREPEATLGSVLAERGLTQLRIAESEKYPHVTYFLNGGREVEFPGEQRVIVPSPDVPTYDERPEMSAREVTDRAVEEIERDDPDVVVLNYANPDMVGHTGDFDAAVAAVEAVDRELGRLVAAVHDAGAHVLVTADHGNADDMGTADDPHTAHTANPVPFVYLASDGGDGDFTVRDGGTLADVTPTLLSLLGIEQPDVMTGASLLVSG